ncbi:MAG: response regulator [Sphingobacteriales bacterium]|nr:MAG: response regulator [Sphingobacteriales bacterium]
MFELLLIEDNPGDIRLAKEALTECEIPHRLHLATDGNTAIQFLFREGPYEHVPRPDLIFLDWNLPKVNGEQILRIIKSHHELKQIPILVFTSSNETSDIRKAYNLHANCFITKPLEFNQYLEVMFCISRLWLYTEKIPASV